MRLIKHIVATTLLVALICPSLANEESTQEASKHYESAVKAFNKEEVAEAFIHLKNALKINPQHLSAKLLLAKVFFNDGNLYAAEKEFEECLALGSDINLILPLYGGTLLLQQKPNALLLLGKYSNQFTRETEFEWQLLRSQAYLQKSNPESAKTALEKAIEIFPSNTRAINSLSIYYMGHKNLLKAKQLADHSLQINDLNEKTWQLKGAIANQENDLESALKFFSKAFEIDPTDPKILRSLTRTYLQRGELSSAQKYLELILEQSPNDPTSSLLTAIIQLSDGNQGLGMQMLADLSDKLTLLDETKLDQNGSALFIKATTEYIQGNFEKARTTLGNYLGKNPGDLAAIRMLVDLYLKNNGQKQAIQLLQDQQKYIAKDFGLTAQLTSLYITERKLFTAREQLKKLEAIASEHPYITMLEADILNAERQPGQALKLLSSYNFLENEPLIYSLKRGRLEIETGDLDKALSSANQLLEKYPDNPAVLSFAAAISLKRGDTITAKTYISRALQSNPNDLTARYNQALSLKMGNQFEQAVSSAKDILNEHPEHIPSILLIARTRLEEREYDEALEWVQKVNAYDKANLSAKELELEIFTRTEDWNSGINTARQLYKISPGTPRYLVQQANLLLKAGKPEQAQRPLNLLFSTWIDQPQQLRLLAQLQISSGNKDGARKSLQTALKLDNNAYGIALDLARLELLDGDHRGAVSAANELNKKFGDRAGIELLKGDIALQISDLQKARKHYLNAFTLDKNSTKAITMLYQLTLSGEGEKAFTLLLEKHIKSSDAPLWQSRLLADSYLNQGDFEKAQFHYEKLARNPELENDPQLLNNLANIYARTDIDKALITARKALEEGATYPPLLDTIGWLYLEKNQFETALSYLRDAFALDSSNPEIRYHQGIALANLDRKREALKEFRAAVQSGKTFPGMDDANHWIEKLEQ